MRVLIVMLAGSLAFAAAPAVLSAQAAQVASSLGELPLAMQVARIPAELTALRETRERAPAAWDVVIAAGQAVLDSPQDAETFEERVRTYQRLKAELVETYGPITAAGLRGTTIIPQQFSDRVAFTVGYDHSWGKGFSRVSSFTVATNLLGAAVGSVFDALGSESLQKYFAKNVAAGTSIPSGSRNTLTAQVGLGLGKRDIWKVTLWPAINFEQTDTADSRTPLDLRTRRAGQQVWSAPTFALGIVPPKLRMAGVDRLTLIPIVGVRVPHYYPGDPFSALAALFTTKRSDFIRSGGLVYSVGVSMPLERTDQ
jgi:hypothetical protein